MANGETPTAADLDAWFEQLSNWGRWGPDEELGALNLITEAKRAEAGALVREGVAVSCALELPTQPAPDNPTPVRHAMLAGGDIPAAGGGLQFSSDYFAIASHGMATTHLDALCHVFHRDQMYNGYPSALVTSQGARRNSIMAGKDGIVSRGVLLDIPALRGVDYLEPGEGIEVSELEVAEARQGVQVGAGDILLVRTGRDTRRERLGPWSSRDEGLAGLAADALPWLRARDVAVLGCDGVSDRMPAAVPEWPMPFHQIALVAMGVHLIDNMQLTRLAEACAARERWAFLLTVAPLRLDQGTASPVNPIALF